MLQGEAIARAKSTALAVDFARAIAGDDPVWHRLPPPPTLTHLSIAYRNQTGGEHDFRDDPVTLQPLVSLNGEN